MSRRGFMGRGLSTGRSFESKVTERRSRESRRGSFFQRLLRLTIRHGYFNDSDGLAPDYHIRPTLFSEVQMRSLGLRFRLEESGFSVLYDTTREHLLLRYLQRQANAEGSSGAWFRLSFSVALNNPYFLNFTDMSIACNPSEQNLYYTNYTQPQNQENQEDPDEREAAGDLLEPQGPWDVVPVQLAVPVPLTVAAVQLVDVAGQVVECRPRCPSLGLLKPGLVPGTRLREIRCDDLEYLTLECRNDTVFVDFGLLREDKYEIRKIDGAGEPLGEATPVIYTETFPQPFAFVDLLLSRPEAKAPGIYPPRMYPVCDDFTEVRTKSYRIDFAPRSTVWRYYVVPREQRPLEDVLIEQWERPEPPYRVTFTPAEKVPVPGGEWAYRLTSEQELTLLRDSPWRFRLQAKRGDSTVQVECLPVASVEQVLPECVQHDDNGLCVQRVNYSDVYVTV